MNFNLEVNQVECPKKCFAYTFKSTTSDCLKCPQMKSSIIL
jgi:hypothetical protein